ncbi:MAG: DnaD domain protein [Alicyclobacillus macrosporangiidus]|uniref:DnaD domain-containing protein n=1 Tax=Alicyclobacillus macrosporangiidus TaxID=392015 RepID=UPI0026ED2D84|nr:DnaD domain protein [Alicyclobacillus macrosporangiidus]MCL6599546.1 DnaD domain protein [Alicyclobacillus macrosporangiidus]
MNYIREINAFYDWLETNGLDASCIALWHALMAIANKAGWPDEFAVAISVLEAKTGMNKKAVERARNRLQQCGLITWRSRRGNQSALYTIKSLCDIYDPQNVPQSVAQSVPQDVPQGVSQSVAISKRNETKQDISGGGDHAPVRVTDLEIRIQDFYERTFGHLPNETQVSRLSYWCERGMDEDVIYAAILKARERGKGFDYVLGILKNQFERGIRTLAHVEMDDARHETAAGGVKVEYEVRRGTGPPTRGPNGRRRSITGGKVGRV